MLNSSNSYGEHGDGSGGRVVIGSNDNVNHKGGSRRNSIYNNRCELEELKSFVLSLINVLGIS